MPILNRVKRLFQADVHAILDVIEEPEAVLKQAIREMQESLDQKQGQLTSSHPETHYLSFLKGCFLYQIQRFKRTVSADSRDRAVE